MCCVCLCFLTIAQVYAAYSYRRDLAEAAKPSRLDTAAASSISRHDLQQQHYPDNIAGGVSSSGGDSGGSSTSGRAPLESPLMRQAIAWQLCHRELMHQQIRHAAELLKRELKAEDVKELKVSCVAVRGAAVSCRMVMLPGSQERNSTNSQASRIVCLRLPAAFHRQVDFGPWDSSCLHCTHRLSPLTPRFKCAQAVAQCIAGC
jgi:hypothetical protein